MLSIGVKELLESGVHFGHQTKRWNPKMKPFIFDARNGIHIIDLSKTLTQLEAACDFLSNTVRKGGKVIFVGTKKQAQQCVKDTAKECGQFYVVERWLGGTLTNYNTLKTSLKRLKEIEKMNTDGSINDYVKQEQAMIHREEARLHKYFDGISAMDNSLRPKVAGILVRIGHVVFVRKKDIGDPTLVFEGLDEMVEIAR